MSQLQLTCLGDFQVTLAGEPLGAFQTDKMRALLVYLALEGEPHQRSNLAQLLWPGYDQESARHSFRQYLYQLRLLLHDAEADPSWLLVTRQTVQFNPAAPLSLDAARFTQLISETTTHAHAQLTTCQPCLGRLAEAAALYRGNFLTGFTLADSDPFEEWRQLTQEQLHLQALEVLGCLADSAALAGDDKTVQHFAQRQLELEPWCEAAHRQLMRSLLRVGRRQAALAQYQLCRQVLAAELGVAPEAETLALYEQILSGEFDKETRRASNKVSESPPHPLIPTQGVPAPHPLIPSPHNLPAQLTPFIGRDRELASIIGQLDNPTVRLVTLLGVGGMGKTRLALQAGKTIAECGVRGAEYETDAFSTLHSPLSTFHFSDGVFFVSLVPIQRASEMVLTVASALGVTISSGDPFEALLRFLQPKRLLLILDNFEHLLGTPSLAAGDNQPNASRLVSELLQGAPAVKILVTSRERLNVRGEHLYQVEGMDHALRSETPTPGARLVRGHLLAAANNLPAVQLFSQCVRQVQTAYAVTAADLDAVLQICTLVQGMPLGIEMAAAWAAQLSLREIADEIQRSSDFLAVDWPDAPARQRSMRAVFDWSWHLLPAAEQRVLRQLSVFAAGFTRSAAEAIAGASLPILVSLVNKSLLQRKEERYALHELLRQFAKEQLVYADGERDAAARHSTYYLAFVAEREVRLARHEPRQASEEIQTEVDNVRQAWAWAVASGPINALEPAIHGWWQFCLFRGLESEGRNTFALAAEGLRQRLPALGNGQAAHQQGARALSKLLAIHAYYLFAQGKDEKMAAQAREAIALGAASGGVEGETLGTFVLGRALQELGLRHEAGAMWQKTIELVRAYHTNHGDNELLHEAEWMAYNWLRGNSNYFEDYIGGRAQMVEALRICQALGKQRGTLYCLIDLASTDFLQGDYAAAEQGFTATIGLARKLGYSWGKMMAQTGLGDVLCLQGEYRLAENLFVKALAVATDSGSQYDEILLLSRLVRLYSYMGNQAAGQPFYEPLTQLLSTAQLPKECHVLGLLAFALWDYFAEEYQRALVYAQQAWQIIQTGESLHRRADAALILGHTGVAMQQWAAAVEAYEEAIDCYHKLGNTPFAVEAQAGLAQIALAQGNLCQAQQWVERLLPVLADHPHVGINPPFGVYLTCYGVLMAANDPRSLTVLQGGYELLQQYSQHIQDDDLRASFLEKVSLHRALRQAYRNEFGSNTAES